MAAIVCWFIDGQQFHQYEQTKPNHLLPRICEHKTDRNIWHLKSRSWLMIGSAYNLLILIVGWFPNIQWQTCDAYWGREQVQYCKTYIQDRRRSRPTTAKTFDCHVSFMDSYVWTIQINILLQLQWTFSFEIVGSSKLKRGEIKFSWKG